MCTAQYKFSGAVCYTGLVFNTTAIRSHKALSSHCIKKKGRWLDGYALSTRECEMQVYISICSSLEKCTRQKKKKNGKKVTPSLLQEVKNCTLRDTEIA